MTSSYPQQELEMALRRMILAHLLVNFSVMRHSYVHTSISLVMVAIVISLRHKAIFGVTAMGNSSASALLLSSEGSSRVKARNRYRF